MMKKRGRSKNFFCFRPVVVDDGAVNSDPKDFSGDPALPCTAVGGGGGKESAVIPKILKSLSDKKSKDSSDVDVTGGEARCRKKKSPRRFTRLIKAVLFDMTLVSFSFSINFCIISLLIINAILNRLHCSYVFLLFCLNVVKSCLIVPF